MNHVTLKIPLPLLMFGGLFQCNDLGGPGIQVLHEPLDRSAFSGGIAAFEDDHDFLAAHLDPVLHLQKLDLKLGFFFLVLGAGNTVGIGVFAFIEKPTAIRP